MFDCSRKCNTDDLHISKQEYCEVSVQRCLPCRVICFDETVIERDCKSLCPSFYREYKRRLYESRSSDNLCSDVSKSVFVAVTVTLSVLLLLATMAIIILILKYRRLARRKALRWWYSNASTDKPSNKEPSADKLEFGEAEFDDTLFNTYHSEVLKRAPGYQDAFLCNGKAIVVVNPEDAKSALRYLKENTYRIYKHKVVPRFERSISNTSSQSQCLLHSPEQDDTSSSSDLRITCTEPDSYPYTGRGTDSCPYTGRYIDGEEPSNMEPSVDELDFGELEFNDTLFNTYRSEILKNVQGYRGAHLQDGKAVIGISELHVYSALRCLKEGGLSFYKHKIVPPSEVVTDDAEHDGEGSYGEAYDLPSREIYFLEDKTLSIQHTVTSDSNSHNEPSSSARLPSE